MPASAASLDVISAYASRGELLAVGSTEGGVHPELALFLGSEVQPVGERARYGAVGKMVTGSSNESYGIIVLGNGPGATTVFVKPGFRIILFTDSVPFSRVPVPSVDINQSKKSINGTSLLFLEDLPHALAQLQLIRFGGMDYIGSGLPAVSSFDDYYLHKTQREHTAGNDSDDGDPNSSNASQKQEGTPIPSLVLAGLGLGQAPGFETSMALGDRLHEHVIGALRSDVGGAQLTDSATALAKAHRDTLCYSNELGTTHESVLALLSARPRCFDPALESVPLLESGIPSGGQSRNGLSDEIERDQNRIINNLIETISAYQNTVKKVHSVVPLCDRASQAELAQKLKSERLVGRKVSSSIVRTLARMSEMLHAWDLDPALYCPTSSGVRALMSDAIRQTISAKNEEDEKWGQDGEKLEHCMLRSLTEIFVRRVTRECGWVVPLAVMAEARPNEFPADGWWDTCTVLLADRHRLGHSIRNHFDLSALVGMTAPSAASKSADTEKVHISRPSTRRCEQHFASALDDNGEVLEQAAITRERLEQVHSVVGVWLDHEDPSVHVQAIKGTEDTECGGSSSDECDDLTKGRAIFSPHHWELGFDTSDWARNRVTVAALEFARKESRSAIPSEAIHLPHEKNTKANGNDADSSGEHLRNNGELFFTRISELWNTAKEERANLSPAQAEAAGRFRQDDVLRRLVLLEATMNGVFARLPCYVLCQPNRWANWIEVVSNDLRSTELGLSDATKLLHYQLSNPPPVFGSTDRRANSTDGEADDICPRDGSTSSSSNSSSFDLSSDENDSNSGNDANPRSSSTKGPAAEVKDSTGKILSAGGPAAEPVMGMPRVRRDSRERIKAKLGNLDGVEEGLARENSEGSMVVKEEFVYRATNLFGVSSHSKQVGAKRVPFSEKSASREMAKMSPGTTKPFSYFSQDAESAEGHSDGQEEYITFVAESFRPQRDNSDWHREVISTPPPTLTPAMPAKESTATSEVTVVPDKDSDGESLANVPATTEGGKSDDVRHSEARKEEKKKRKEKQGRASETENRDVLATKPRSKQPQKPR